MTRLRRSRRVAKCQWIRFGKDSVHWQWPLNVQGAGQIDLALGLGHLSQASGPALLVYEETDESGI